MVFIKQGKYAGTVTSAMWSPSAKASIALASLEAPLGHPLPTDDGPAYRYPIPLSILNSKQARLL